MVWETLDLKQIKDLVAGEDIGVPIIEKKEKKPIIGEDGSLIHVDKNIPDDGVIA